VVSHAAAEIHQVVVVAAHGNHRIDGVLQQTLHAFIGFLHHIGGGGWIAEK